MFIINLKNYEEIAGTKALKLAKAAEKISKKYRIKIAVAPPQHLLALLTRCSIPVLAQHLDTANIG
ncbi:MAG TPA: triose-phosphate isomerase, partial [Nitrosopumilaceae archaeon]|nr:triose-phosphate isomerase [Nitrosopumilaceae archaeon]